MVEPERKGTVMTTKPKKRTLGTEKVSRKDPVTIYVENRTRGLIIECLEEGTQLDMMCDLWYEMKDDPFVVQSKKANETEKKYSDKIAKIIYTAFYDYAKTDPYVYDKLGLHSRILEKGEVPIVVIFEKEKKVALPIVHEFHAGYAFSEGQFPSFESVHVANYFNECGYSKGYIFVVTDYDPAGEDLYKQVQEKMNKFSNIDIETIWVKYGDEPTIEFGSYQLKNNKINKNWIDSGRERGVEFNTPSNIRKGILTYLKKSILTYVDPRYYVLHSYNEWVRKEKRELALGDDTYQKWSDENSRLEKLMRERMCEFDESVAMIETDYAYDISYPHYFICVTSPKEEYDFMSHDDLLYYDALLGEKSPYHDKTQGDVA